MIFTGIFLYCWCELASCARMIELNYAYNKDTMTWINYPRYKIAPIEKGYSDKGFWFESYKISLAEHTGTHMDAPSHYAKGKWSVDQIPLDRLIGPVVVMDISEKVSTNPTAELSVDDVTSWLDTNGEIPDGAIVLVRTGWGKYYGNKTAYFGPDPDNLVYPGISPSAAKVLVDYERTKGHRVVGVGLDTPSVDHGPSTLYETHQILAKANVYGLENLANLEKVPVKGAIATVMPMKLEGGSGAPVRIVVTLQEPLVQPSLIFLLVTAVLGLAILRNFC